MLQGARLRSDVLQLNRAISAAAWPQALLLLRKAERNVVSFNATLRGEDVVERVYSGDAYGI